jgi:hypothetical protein
MRKAYQQGFYSKKIIENRRKIVLSAIENHASDKVLKETLLKRRSDSDDTKLMLDFMSFEQPVHRVKRDYHYNRALRVTAELFRPKEKLRPVHFPDLRYYPWTLNTSAEAPWSYESGITDILRQKQAEGKITDGRRSFHNLYDEIFERNRRLIHFIKDKHEKFWTKEGTPKTYEFVNLHARAHVVDQNEPDKIRAVFGVTKLLLMAEQHFIYPLQEQYLNGKTDSPMLWGNEMIKGGWRKLYNKVYRKHPHNTVLSIDWSQFDKRALHEIIDDVHNIWRSYFTLDDGYVPTNFYPNSQTEPERLENLWQWMCYSIKHTPICLPDGKLFSWSRNGIASGFQQTQLLDSFVNTIMILTLLSKSGINIESPNFFIKVQGDDSLIAFPENLHQIEGQHYLERLATMAMDYFNAKLNSKKSQISNSLNGIKVLGYSNNQMMPFRHDSDLLSHLLYPERSFGLPELAATAVGIAWASLGCSPIVYSVCKDIHSFLLDKLGVKPKASSFEWLIRMGSSSLDEFNIERFPYFAEIFDTAFCVQERTTKMKERLYPTRIESAGGFVFLPY